LRNSGWLFDTMRLPSSIVNEELSGNSDRTATVASPQVHRKVITAGPAKGSLALASWNLKYCSHLLASSCRRGSSSPIFILTGRQTNGPEFFVSQSFTLDY